MKPLSSFLKGPYSKVAPFLTSQAISLFGSSLVQYAIMWHITLATKNGFVLAIYSVCSFGPQLLMSLFGGAFADRYNRKILIMLADGFIAASTLVLALLLRGGVQGLAPIYIIAALRALGSGIQQPAVNALLPQITPEEKLMRINSVNGTIQSVVMLVAPAVAGAVLAFGSLPAILMIDVVTAAIGIFILAFIPVPPHIGQQNEQKMDVMADIKIGIRYTAGNFFVRRLLAYYLVASLLIIPISMFNVLFVTLTYGGSYQLLTFNEMSFFIGSIVGGIALAAWGGFKNRLYTLVGGAAVFGFTGVLMGFVPPFVAYLAIMLVAGLTMPTFNTPVMVLLQEKVPPDILGRTFSLMQIVAIAVMMAGSMLFGPLLTEATIRWVIMASGALLMVGAVVLSLDKRFLAEGLPPKEVATSQTDARANTGGTARAK